MLYHLLLLKEYGIFILCWELKLAKGCSKIDYGGEWEGTQIDCGRLQFPQNDQRMIVTWNFYIMGGLKNVPPMYPMLLILE